MAEIDFARAGGPQFNQELDKIKDPERVAEIFDEVASDANIGFEKRLTVLKRLKDLADAGDISGNQFAELATPLARRFGEELARVGGGRGAFARDFFNQNTGFDLGDDFRNPVLREDKFESGFFDPVKEGLDPSGEIPRDIPFGSDRFDIEREALRQQSQARTALEEILGIRGAGRQELASVLAGQQERLFEEAVPNILEQSQAAGLLRSTGTGEALGREAGRLAAGTSEALALAGLGDIDVQSQGLQNILNQRLGFQTSGLQRSLSLEDFQREANLAQLLGAQAAPQIDDAGSKGFNLGSAFRGGAQGALTGALVGSAFGQPAAGAAIGGLGLFAGGGLSGGGQGGGK